MTFGRFGLALLLAGIVSGPAAAQTAADPAQVAAARAAMKGLGESLKSALVAALEGGGPVAAIEACRTAAPALGAAQSTTHAMKVGRTALKVRNPANAPDAWERKVLEGFVEKLKAGADIDKLDQAEVVDVGGVRTFRYMKAIPMAAAPCLLCHGAELKPEIKAEIAKSYPADQATGFAPGELRGAFTISAPAK